MGPDKTNLRTQRDYELDEYLYIMSYHQVKFPRATEIIAHRDMAKYILNEWQKIRSIKINYGGSHATK